MQQSISKLCADSLRTLAKDEYGIKLKPAHAHELVAAYLGYRSKNALLAEKKYPISDLAKAEVVVMIPDEEIDQRRRQLDGLPTELPDSYTLGEAVYGPLFSDKWWGSKLPPFKSFDKLAKVLLTNSSQYDAAFPFHRDIPTDHFVSVEAAEDFVQLTVVHAHSSKNEDSLAHGYTTVTLPRVAGRIGYGAPKLMPTVLSGGMQVSLKSLGVRP